MRDIRDNNDYTIAKLADGKCWMTLNLSLAPPIALTPQDSDVSTNFTLTNTGWCYEDTAACHNKSSVYYDVNYGGWYNWYAATAGTGTHSVTAGNATGSICPKGWRLPSGGPYGEYVALVSQYPGTALNGRPADFALTGVFSAYWQSVVYLGEQGFDWSATADDADVAWYINLYASQGAGGASRGRKYDGLSVRCLAR